MTDYDERRQYQRLLFAREERIPVTVSLPAYATESVRAHILNISEGGVGIVFNERDASVIHEGGQAVLTSIIDGNDLVLSDVVTEIKWVLSHKQTKTVRAGLEYVDLPPEMKAHLRQYINARMTQKMETAEKDND